MGVLGELISMFPKLSRQITLICKITLMLIPCFVVIKDWSVSAPYSHLEPKTRKSMIDYCKADSEQRVLFLFITIFPLAIPAFFRFTDVTELM